MPDDEQRLLEDAKRSREETQELREQGEDADSDVDETESPREGEPWAKASSGDANDVVDDDA